MSRCCGCSNNKLRAAIFSNVDNTNFRTIASPLRRSFYDEFERLTQQGGEVDFELPIKIAKEAVAVMMNAGKQAAGGSGEGSADDILKEAEGMISGAMGDIAKDWEKMVNDFVKEKANEFIENEVLVKAETELKEQGVPEFLLEKGMSKVRDKVKGVVSDTVSKLVSGIINGVIAAAKGGGEVNEEGSRGKRDWRG